VIVLLLPAPLVLMLFGLDALENFLFPRLTDRSETERRKTSKNRFARHHPS
jgi:hypothetical protein